MGAYTDDVLFIHIPKTGGTSAKEYMRGLWPDLRWPRPSRWFASERGGQSVTPTDRARADATRDESGLDFGHIPLFDIERLTGRRPDSWDRIIAIIRNPYEQQVSQWWFWHTRWAEGQYHPSDMIAGMHPRFPSWLRDPRSDFHRWYEIRRRSENQWPAIRDTISEAPRGYYRWWVEVDGEIPNNVVILKMEEMATTLPAALAPYCSGPMPDVPKLNEGLSIDWHNALIAGVVEREDGEFDGIEYAQQTMELLYHKFRWTFEQGYYPSMGVKFARQAA